jgi:hypothetical protein
MGFSPQCFHSFVEGEWVQAISKVQVPKLAFPLHTVSHPHSWIKKKIGFIWSMISNINQFLEFFIPYSFIKLCKIGTVLH